MRRNNRRSFNGNEDRESKKLVIISVSVLLIAVLAFAVTYVVYSNYLNKSLDIADFDSSSITSLQKTNELTSSQASSSIGKTVNEMQEGTNEVVNNISNNANTNSVTNSSNNEKIAINTSNMEKENSKTTTQQQEKTKVETTTKTETKKEEPVPDPTFKKPVEGEITSGFAKDTLIYSNTLQEWITHNGIDIKADKATIVTASAEGTIKSIKNDPRFGITVVIEHVNGFSSVYANLLTAEFVKEGEKVKQGQTIGTVGNTATFEIADEPHLHFEILKDNENVDPNLYLK